MKIADNEGSKMHWQSDSNSSASENTYTEISSPFDKYITSENPRVEPRGQSPIESISMSDGPRNLKINAECYGIDYGNIRS